jgi:hypothetical protein
MSYNGAAAATVFTEFLMLLAMWALMARTIPVRGLLPVGKLALVGLLSAVVCAITSALTATTGLPWPFVVAAAVALFVAGAFTLRLVDTWKVRA